MLSDIRKNRIKKAKNIQSLGINPYPAKTKRSHRISEVMTNFKELAESQKEIILAGRIRSIREHGGSTFLHLEDETSRFQAYFKKDRLGEKGYKFFLDNFDIGDFIETRGILFETKKGEKTLKVSDFKILAKSLLPLPEKWHGLKDVEIRFRKRYLDFLMNEEVKNKFKLRDKIIREIRKFLEKEEFIEVETPILQPIPGGATAKPFKTHLNALNLDLYLRIAPELYIKRLLVGGFEKVYEIGRCFRNEGMDKSHNPDFTMLEFYWAYADYKDLMKFTERMFENLLQNLFQKAVINYEGKEIDFKLPWLRIEFTTLLKKYTKIEFEEINRDALKKKAETLGLKIGKTAGKEEIAEEIYKKICLPKIFNPTFVVHQPISLTPLAKSLEKEPSKAARFQLIVGGWELVNAFSELNDPQEQKKRFKFSQSKTDKDFLEALEYGMPPAAGFGLGIDRLVALLTDSHSLREVILFPTMRPK